MESAIEFKSGANTLRGIVHMPDGAAAPARSGVVFLHGWSGCRIGPHRMFVKLARRLCDRGCACLRFDFAGRGDSDGCVGDASIDSMIDDTLAGMGFFAREAGVARPVLLGICSGSKVAVGAAVAAENTAGLVLLSHELMGDPRRGKETDARKSRSTLKTYLLKLTQPATWKKILTGRVNTGMVGKALFRQEAPDEDELVREARWLQAFADYAAPLLFIYGGNDPTAQAARGKYEDFCRAKGLNATFHELPDANHSFYSLEWEDEVMGVVEGWVESTTTAFEQPRRG